MKSISIELASTDRITIDASDRDRIAQHKWYRHPSGGNSFTFANGQQLLAGFILGVPSSVYVEQIKPGADYRKRNLRVYRAPLPKETR